MSNRPATKCRETSDTLKSESRLSFNKMCLCVSRKPTTNVIKIYFKNTVNQSFLIGMISSHVFLNNKIGYLSSVPDFQKWFLALALPADHMRCLTRC